MSEHADTIAAIATPGGRGGIGVVRVSGPRVAEIARGVLGELPTPRVATLRTFRGADGAALDEGLALYFPAPNSFTGEDVLELHGHGGPVVLGLVLDRARELGARLAAPGEFSSRAFLNDKLDLAQAEAIADLIDAQSAQAARAALRSLHGDFSRAVEGLVDGVAALRTYVEAAIDFPDDEVDFLSDGRVAGELAALKDALAELLRRASQGARLREGVTLVIAGAPNVGKSSLMNALTGTEAAIVTDIPGTTRDVLRERLEWESIALHLVDTAGLRATADPIEEEGVRRARRETTQADGVILVVDARDPERGAALRSELERDVPVLLVRNKVDLTAETAGVEEGGAVCVSARTGAGLDALRAHIKERFGLDAGAEDAVLARRRHLDALARAAAHFEAAGRALAEARASELVAEELRLAEVALGEITGAVTPDDLLGRIFATFCIGK